MHYMLLLITLPALLAIVTLNIKREHPWRNLAISLAILTVYGFLSSRSEFTLDRSTGKATLRQFDFFHWTTQTYDLSQIDRLYVSTGSTTSQIRIQFADGYVKPIRLPRPDRRQGPRRLRHESIPLNGAIRSAMVNLFSPSNSPHVPASNLLSHPDTTHASHPAYALFNTESGSSDTGQTNISGPLFFTFPTAGLHGRISINSAS
jgi:hypothetical protein